MSKKSTMIVTALLAFGVFVSVYLYLRVPAGAGYGRFPKLIAGALGLLCVLPACGWAAFANIRSKMGKGLLATLVCTVAAFVYLNVIQAEFFDLQVMSFPVLAFGLSLSALFTLVLVYRGWRA